MKNYHILLLVVICFCFVGCNMMKGAKQDIKEGFDGWGSAENWSQENLW